MKHHVVLFGDHGARIITCDDALLEHFQGMPNVAIDPDLSEVAGISPHNWKLENSKVVKVNNPTHDKPAMTQHTVILNKDFLKPHLSRTHRTVLLSALGISLAVSIGIHFLFHYLGV